MPKSKCLTVGCAGDPTVPGSAGGRCPRCYQRHRRGLPPTAAPAYRADGEAGVEVRVPLQPGTVVKARVAALRRNVTLSAWIRDLVVEKLSRSR